jgi:hypothetical protein
VSNRRHGLAAALFCSALAVGACGTGPTSAAHAGAASASAPPSARSSNRAGAAPAAQHEELFAALEPGGLPPGADGAVAIVGLNGFARAKATFTPRQVPVLFDAATVLQPEARVVAGGVLYADGAGQVRRLSIGGARNAVAAFPIAAQQDLSFAASADGAHLEAVRFSFPPLKVPRPADPSQGLYAQGNYDQDVLVADAGQQPTTVAHQSWPQSTTQIPMLAIVGWTQGGPLATANTSIGTQNPMPGQRLFGQLVHLDGSGHPGQIVGGPDCFAWDFLQDDTVLCGGVDLRGVSIRTGSGQTLYTLSGSSQHQYGDLTLSTDGARFTAEDLNQNDAVVFDRAGHATALPAGFTAEGWLDPVTVVGARPDGVLEYVRVDQASRPVDLGFKGLFIGPVN